MKKQEILTKQAQCQKLQIISSFWPDLQHCINYNKKYMLTSILVRV